MNCETCKNIDLRCQYCDEFSEYSDSIKIDCRNCVNQKEMHCINLGFLIHYSELGNNFYILQLATKPLVGTEIIRFGDGKTQIMQKRDFFYKIINLEGCKKHEPRQ